MLISHRIQRYRKMVSFTIRNISRAYAEDRQMENPYLDAIVNIEADFEFIINGQTIIAAPHWNIVEFAEQLWKWNQFNNTDSFTYVCVDVHQVDLFKLIKKSGSYQLISDWAWTDEDVFIHKSELNAFIQAYTDAVVSKVKESIGVDLQKVRGLILK